MDYIVLEIITDPELCDILIAELSELGFDSFLESDSSMEASCARDLFDSAAVEAVLDRYKDWTSGLSYVYKEVPKINWNEEWEKNYDPIFIGTDIHVRATFHEAKPEFTHEIVIDPKMSFGTGHHATTSMMLSHQLDIDHLGKIVLDAGTGTGILAIMAEKLGAERVVANDLDPWCMENSRENIALNQCRRIEVLLGTIPELRLSEDQFDIILANINKNVLLSEIPYYCKLLKTNGLLLLSGFYEADLQDIRAEAEAQGLVIHSYKTKNNWCSPIFQKNN